MFGQGNLDLHDEVSLDGRHWIKLIETDVLRKAAEPAHKVATDDDWRQERAKARVRWGDEAAESGAAPNTDDAIGRLRQVEQETRDLIDARASKRPALVGGLVLILVLLLAGVGIWLGQSGNINIRAEQAVKVTDCNGPPGDSAKWSGCDKNDASLAHAVLRNADLKGAHFERADLSGADLSYADMQTADLRGADLRGAILRAANLSQVDLTGADLTGADLGYTVMSGAVVDGARFDGTNLGKARWIDGRLCGAESVGTCQ